MQQCKYKRTEGMEKNLFYNKKRRRIFKDWWGNVNEFFTIGEEFKKKIKPKIVLITNYLFSFFSISFFINSTTALFKVNVLGVSALNFCHISFSMSKAIGLYFLIPVFCSVILFYTIINNIILFKTFYFQNKQNDNN